MTEAEFATLKRLAECSARLLADANFLELVATLKNDAIRKWSESTTIEAQRSAWYDLHAVGKLETKMRKFPETLRHENRTIEAARKKEA
jgi:hypothetical protein